MGYLRLFVIGLLFSAALVRADDPIRDIKELAAGGKPPVSLKRDVPLYPSNMRSAGLGGAVTIEFIIDPTGNVVNPIVLASNNPWFERPAIEAILKWKFRPGEVNGQKVYTRAAQIIEFQTEYSPEGGLWKVPRPKNPEKLPPELRWSTPPQPLKSAFPVYPFTALTGEQGGKTEIGFLIGPDGRVASSRVISASAPELGQAVIAMIETWEFSPPKQKDGKACFAALTMSHEFKPRGSGDVPITDEAREILKQLAKHPENIVSLKELDAQPKPLSRRPPVYPGALRKAGQAGQAMIEFYIAPNGDAELPRIVSSTAPEFGYAAVQAVATWRFESPRKAGKKITARVQVPIAFELPRNPAAPAGNN